MLPDRLKGVHHEINKDNIIEAFQDLDHEVVSATPVTSRRTGKKLPMVLINLKKVTTIVIQVFQCKRCQVLGTHKIFATSGQGA